MTHPKLIEEGIVVQTAKARYVFPTLYFTTSTRVAIGLVLAASRIHVAESASDAEIMRAIARHPNGDDMLRALMAFFPAAAVYQDGRIELSSEESWETVAGTVRFKGKFPGVNSTNYPYKFWGK